MYWYTHYYREILYMLHRRCTCVITYKPVEVFHVNVAIGLVISERYGSLQWLLIDSSLELLLLLLLTLTNGTYIDYRRVGQSIPKQYHVHTCVVFMFSSCCSSRQFIWLRDLLYLAFICMGDLSSVSCQ